MTLEELLEHNLAMSITHRDMYLREYKESKEDLVTKTLIAGNVRYWRGQVDALEQLIERKVI